VSLDSEGLVIGTDIALGLTSGLTIGDSMSLTTESLVLGRFFGDSNQWKIWFDATNDILKFDYYDTGSGSYITKMQLKPTD